MTFGAKLRHLNRDLEVNIELEKWLLDALKIGSSHRVVIEAFGTPGSGKSYFSNDLLRELVKMMNILYITL